MANIPFSLLRNSYRRVLQSGRATPFPPAAQTTPRQHSSGSWAQCPVNGQELSQAHPPPQEQPYLVASFEAVPFPQLESHHDFFVDPRRQQEEEQAESGFPAGWFQEKQEEEAMMPQFANPEALPGLDFPEQEQQEEAFLPPQHPVAEPITGAFEAAVGAATGRESPKRGRGRPQGSTDKVKRIQRGTRPKARKAREKKEALARSNQLP